MESSYEVFELKRETDKFANLCKCPKCGKKYLYSVAYVKVPCRDCGISYQTDFGIDIYTKRARILNQKLAYADGVIIRADEEYEMAATTIHKHFTEQNCWTLSKITTSIEEHKTCLSCGMCLNCFTCKDCGENFKKDVKKRKLACPKCKSTNISKTHFKDVEINEHDKDTWVCPECKSDSIVMTKTKNKLKCHACESENLSELKTKTIFEFVIERKKAYRTGNA